MSVAGSQQQIYLQLVRTLEPHWRRDPALPARIQAAVTARKEFGSRDRRLYRELLYTTVRYLPWIEPLLAAAPERAVKVVAWLAAESRATSAYRRTASGDWPAAGTVLERAAYLHEEASRLLPDWAAEECPALRSAGELEAQLARAPLWLRLQSAEPARVAAEFASHGWRHEASSELPGAWRMPDEVDVTKSESFVGGEIEIQDLGSQFVLASLGITPGGRWLDACAGAGGKTLQLAALLGPAGHVDAHDVRQTALDELAARARRANGSRHPAQAAPRMAAIRIVGPAGFPAVARSGQYDGVLIDAPCSGSGTWRRFPHLKWITTRDTLRERARLQRQLLAQFSPLVRPGGRLVYATCSLARTENEAVVRSFLAEHPEFTTVPFENTFGFTPGSEGLSILPARHDTDAFFVASLVRR